MADRIGKPLSQRQLRVGEMIKQSLGMIFVRNEAKVPELETDDELKQLNRNFNLMIEKLKEQQDKL